MGGRCLIDNRGLVTSPISIETRLWAARPREGERKGIIRLFPSQTEEAIIILRVVARRKRRANFQKK